MSSNSGNQRSSKKQCREPRSSSSNTQRGRNVPQEPALRIASGGTVNRIVRGVAGSRGVCIQVGGIGSPFRINMLNCSSGGYAYSCPNGNLPGGVLLALQRDPTKHLENPEVEIPMLEHMDKTTGQLFVDNHSVDFRAILEREKKHFEESRQASSSSSTTTIRREEKERGKKRPRDNYNVVVDRMEQMMNAGFDKMDELVTRELGEVQGDGRLAEFLEMFRTALRSSHDSMKEYFEGDHE